MTENKLTPPVSLAGFFAFLRFSIVVRNNRASKYLSDYLIHLKIYTVKFIPVKLDHLAIIKSDDDAVIVIVDIV